jgi:hypothetical protein
MTENLFSCKKNEEGKKKDAKATRCTKTNHGRCSFAARRAEKRQSSSSKGRI